MKRNVFALLRTFVFAAFVPALAFSLVACEPEKETDTEVVGNGGSEDSSGGNSEESVCEAVDLGLSVKWASCNVGATSPEEYGDYFAWGETATKSSYSSSNSVTYDLSFSELESRGIIGSDGNLTAAYDAATANWGDNWRMPTLDEIKELLDDCFWSWTSQNGVNGYLVTGPNGNSIFLPAAGYRYDTGVYGRGSNGYCWSGTLGENQSDNAYGLYFGSGGRDWSSGYRYRGRTVRPVTDK